VTLLKMLMEVFSLLWGRSFKANTMPFQQRPRQAAQLE
jgi:hypothetical protein